MDRNMIFTSLRLVRVDVHQSLALQCSYLLDLSKGFFLVGTF